MRKDLTETIRYYIVSLDMKIQYCEVSYSEWWRYKGSVKPRQPHVTVEGANLSE